MKLTGAGKFAVEAIESIYTGGALVKVFAGLVGAATNLLLDSASLAKKIGIIRMFSEYWAPGEGHQE